MKKILTLGLLFSAFLFITPQANAQNAEQQTYWDTAHAQTEQLAEKMELSENQKAYVTRHLYNYQERTKALEQNAEHLEFSSQSEIDKRLNSEIGEVLDASQFAKFKEMKTELLKKD